MKLHCEILNENQRKLLPDLRFLKQKGFFLAGGTALALQIGHRTSADFDFYTREQFNPQEILDLFQKRTGKNVETIHVGEGTLIVRIRGCEISLFRYPYKMLEPLIEGEDLDLACPVDIGAMKLVALVQRGTRRDFIDFYFVARDRPLKEMIRLTQEKYPPFNPYVCLQALTYFADAEKEKFDERGIVLLNPAARNWRAIKEFFVREARNVKETLK